MKRWFDKPSVGDRGLYFILSHAIVLARSRLEPAQVPNHDCCKGGLHQVELIMLPDDSLSIRLLCPVHMELAAASYWHYEPTDLKLFDLPRALAEAKVVLDEATKRVEKLKELSQPAAA